MQRALLCLVVAAGCLPPIAPAASNVTDVRYRSRDPGNSTIRIYRWFGARSSSVTSRCKMIPTDSEMFAARAERCGGLRAWFWGISRVLLEQANSSRFAPTMRMDGRVRWLDLPASQCGS